MERFSTGHRLAVSTSAGKTVGRDFNDGQKLTPGGGLNNLSHQQQKELLLHEETSASVSPSFFRQNGKGKRWESSPLNAANWWEHREEDNKEVEQKNEHGPAVDEDDEETDNDKVKRLPKSRESELLRLPNHMPTPMALQTHRETVTDVQDFIVSPVPIQLGTLQCELSNFEIPGDGLFGNAVQVWELRVTDHRVKYGGLARFTNVNDTDGIGSSTNGPQLSDLQSNRLVLVAEKRTRGIISKTSSYVFAMAPCDRYHKRVEVERASHLIGKLEGTNCWGTEFNGFHFAKKFKNGCSLIPVKLASMFVKYECSLGNPRQLIVSIPAVHLQGLDAVTQAEQARNKLGVDADFDPRDEDEHRSATRSANKRMPGAKALSRDEEFWKNDIPPVSDPDLGTNIKVIHEYEQQRSLEQGLETFDTENCLCFHNRKPVWDNSLKTHILDFGGRVTRASVKNFQLDLCEIQEQATFVNYASESGEVYTYQAEDIFSRSPSVQFGECEPRKQGETRYTLDVRYPFSVLQAFQLAMTSVENKQMFY